ncbi:MAG: MFS transporter [Candidatus Brocadiia bacterium]
MAPERSVTARYLTVAAWLSLIVFAVTSTLLSVSLRHIGTDFGAGYAQRGALSLVRAVVLAFSALIVGRAADWLGKKWFLSIGMAVTAFGLAWAGFSQSYWWLLAGMVFIAAGLGSLEALVSPLVAELQPEKVAPNMNLLHAFYPAGIVLTSPLVGGALDAGVAWQLPFGLAAAPALLVAALFATGRYPDAEKADRKRPMALGLILKNPRFWLLAVAMVLGAGCEGSLFYWTPNFIETEYGKAALVGAAGLMLYSGTMAVGRFGMGIVTRFVSLNRMLVVLAAVGALASGALALVDSLPATLVLLGVAGLCVASFWPGTLSLAARDISVSSSTVYAMLAMAGIFGFGFAPYGVGLVGEWWGLRAGLWVVPCAFIGATVIFTMALRGAERPRQS